MKISSLLNINSNGNYGGLTSLKSGVSNPVSLNGDKPDGDVFEKSCVVSFKGGFLDDFIDSLVSDVVDKVFSITDYQIQEVQTGVIIDIFSEKRFRQWLTSNKSVKIKGIMDIAYGHQDVLNPDFLIRLFEDSGIKNAFALQHFIQIYSSNPDTKKIFSRQEIEAVKIYGMLQTKDDMRKYPELLLYLYNLNEDSGEQSRIDINKFIDFLKRLGVSDLKDFDKKFAHLSPKFNNFEGISDRVDAIRYLQESYDAKIKFINQDLQNVPGARSNTSEKIYSAQPDIIDYLYEKNQGESLEPLSSIISDVAGSEKVKPSVMKTVSGYFNDFALPKDKINFYLFLKDSDVSAQDLNALMGQSVISDNESIDNVFNKNMFVSEISEITGKNKDASYTVYKNFKDLFNSLNKKSSADIDGTRRILSLIQTFNLQNASSVLNLYNSIYNTHKKNITTEEFAEFIDIMAYCTSKDILKQAKSLKQIPARLLENERDKYLTVKDAIETFLLSDETEYFTGKTAQEVYFDYKTLINGSEDAASVLRNIAGFKIANPEEYSKKTAKIAELEQYFPDRKTFLNFINSVNIKFDFSPKDEECINNCLKLFAGSESPEQSDYFMYSDFIRRSKNLLGEFFKAYPDEDIQKKILSIIAEKKVPSLSEFNKFIKQYASQDGSYDNILKHFAALPDDVDYERYVNILSTLQKRLNELNVPVKINNDNIADIDIEFFKSRTKLSSAMLIRLLDSILKPENGAIFVSKLPEAFSCGENNYSKFYIAKEFTDRVGKTDESYINIMQKLKLDKKSLQLREDCSDYLYIKAVEQALPEEFVNFVNSNSWVSSDSDKVPNLSLHARMRLIDRFAISNNNSIDELYTQETEKSLRNFLNTIYTNTPNSVIGENNRIIVDTIYNDSVIEIVFTSGGRMVTIVPKSDNFRK